ncbi:hypothetical protein [Bacillus altitudinis]|uniref:hypothetical protein n=1 Tax=Bacillus altitudinis TaxID=293387 RepID=UPI00228004F4|nr:hypothetical protein [Bacillus altitudinis]MCY7439209.1 hypothetical protein [Bacillus altitudinis]MEC1143306.1 hypothetical protein [Bacillus altitudinis]
MGNKFKKGDMVVMHSCMEAELNKGRVWKCADDEFNRLTTKESTIFLEGFSGPFATKFLQKVDVPVIESEMDLYNEIQRLKQELRFSNQKNEQYLKEWRKAETQANRATEELADVTIELKNLQRSMLMEAGK